jgi:hypothetical protein
MSWRENKEQTTENRRPIYKEKNKGTKELKNKEA